MQTFKKILFLLTPRERKSASLLLLMILIMALLDVIGVASILPFMAVLTNPSLIETNLILNAMFEASNIFGVKNNQQFLFFLGVSVFLLLIFSLIFKALTTYVQTRFIQMRLHSISKRLFSAYLHQPFNWFLSRHSANLGKTILSEVQQVIGSGISPLIDVISKAIVIIALLTLLILADPKLAFVVGLLFGGSYGLIFYFVKSYLKKIGIQQLKSNQSRFLLVNDAFGAAREVKVLGLEQIYIKLFSKSAQAYASTKTLSNVIAQIPRFILEAIAFGGILLMILYQMTQSGTIINSLPIISLYVLAGYRLMPAFQNVYTSFTQLTFVGPSLDKLHDDLKNLEIFNENEKDIELIKLNNKITLNNIHYNYPNTSRTALKEISLSIAAKSTVGFVGATGSGKTTIIDIILGLLEAQKGSLEVDGEIITKQNSRSWQRSIGFVPQHIFLSDNTITENIAFGVEPKDINQEMVEKASKIANLHNFVMDELPKQYKTTIGERGVRLSGGQRQRIGIARALYGNPQILILDEATSALDNQTEKFVMDAINNLNKHVTIIIVAHRLTTVKNCDTIFLLDKGQLKDKGTFEELIKNNDQFRNSTKID